ncbi:DEAD box ATP-dependent RNA helicase, putative [Plasmodium ovale wallikeri]|uniref:ATP-dependent RNA helicase n=2 Tax=Plasmodium ovale TaxID=36330 RepID=A0A1C3KN65_PLAOA|nr:DEAD box ATP-dependent RNA helicase, putative [Plasmodium ovale wallikeri]SBT75485.1 DEAD box ATP-dependent RNA helicase, putative [Plasmodium ovale]
MVLIRNVKNVSSRYKFVNDLKNGITLKGSKWRAYTSTEATTTDAATPGAPVVAPAPVGRSKEVQIKTEERCLIEFANKEKKIVYNNLDDLHEFCLKGFKKFKSDLNIRTSSNREYIPYYFYDSFLSHRSIEKPFGKCIDKTEALKKLEYSTCYSVEEEKRDNTHCSSLSHEVNQFNDRDKETLCDNDKTKKEICCGDEPHNIDIDNTDIVVLENSDDYVSAIMKDELGEKKKSHIYNSEALLLQYRGVKEMKIDSYIKLSLEKNFHMKYFTAVQYCLFPFLLKNFDLLVHSFKSTGKTLAYSVPLLHKIILQINKLKRDCNIKENYVFALIVCPNIILVEQTYAIIKKLIMYHPCNIICHYIHGRKNMNMQGEINELKKKKPHIIITTPVSFINHIKYSTCFSKMFFLCDTIIIDEAYFLLNSNYLKNILIIKNVLPKGHQTILLTCLVNNFLKHVAYRFLRLNYVHLNFVDNCIYNSNIFFSSSLMNIVHFNSSEKVSYMKYLAHERNASLQLFHKFNAKLISMYKNNILNCDDLGKLWYCKDARTFYENVNSFDSYIVSNTVCNAKNEQYSTSLNGEDTFLMGEKKDVLTSSKGIRDIHGQTCESESRKRKQNVLNGVAYEKGENNHMEDMVKPNNLTVQSERSISLDERDKPSCGRRKIGKREEPFLEEYAYEGIPNEEEIKKLKLNNSDYNNYTVVSNNSVHYEEDKGKNIPTHILLKQEYLIYESDKLALILFNIICKEFLSNERIKIVIFMPTVKMLQFFYVIFKHYIFKGYLFLLYLKLNNFVKKKSIIHNSFYYDKENVNFHVSSNPFILNDHSFSNFPPQSYKNDNIAGEEKSHCGNLNEECNMDYNFLNAQEERESQKKGTSFDENCYERKKYKSEYEQLKDIAISCLHSKLSLEKKVYTLNIFNNSAKKKQLLFSSSLLSQGIEIDKVDLVVQVGVCASIDEYILRTNIATTKNSGGRSLLLLNELEGHYLFNLYKNNIIISSISKSYLSYVYRDNHLLETLLKYRRHNKSAPINCQDGSMPPSISPQVEKENNNRDNTAKREELKSSEEVKEDCIEKKQKEQKFNSSDYSQFRHIEWYKHKHLLCSCELMYRSLLGFYCEKNKHLKYEKWQVPSLIKSLIYSFGYFENFYITKCMAARLQIINAPDLYIKFNATSKSVLLSSLPSYKGYKSKMNEIKRKIGLHSLDKQFPFHDNEEDVVSHVKDSLGAVEIKPSTLEENSRVNGHVTEEKCERKIFQKHPLYFPIRKYLS